MPSATTEASMPLSNTPISPSAAPSNKARRASLKVLNRNIDEVVLGNLLFRTWYYSPYPDSVLIGESQPASGVGIGIVGPGNSAHARQPVHNFARSNLNGVLVGGSDRGSAGPLPASTTTRVATIPCKRIHVCPYCFRYTPKAGAYVQHLRRHDVTYNPHSEPSAQHLEGDDIERADSPYSDTSDDAATWPVPSTAIRVYEHGGYTVWDVDGEREKLYCQNLSLFGKLFLEQKSVFFDTGGFHYFVLTYTPPPTSSTTDTANKRNSGPIRTSGRRRASSAANNIPSQLTSTTTSTTNVPIPSDINLHTQVLGFFSKENLSWDANNLACILVFPPYQHRNLGQLLMAVSYKLSGWEWEDSIIGGPEKPLSVMGRKSYLRFWSERIARFMMGQTTDADGRRVFDQIGNRKRKKVGYSKEEMTVKDIGDRTGMLAEDVVAALNEMGVMEAVTPKKKNRKSDGDESTDGPVLASMVVQRSRVLEWVKRKGVDLVSPVKEEGFLGEWALSEVEDEVEDEDQDVEEDEVEDESE